MGLITPSIYEHIFFFNENIYVFMILWILQRAHVLWCNMCSTHCFQLGPALKGCRAGVIHFRLFKYTQHTAGLTENSIGPALHKAVPGPTNYMFIWKKYVQTLNYIKFPAIFVIELKTFCWSSMPIKEVFLKRKVEYSHIPVPVLIRKENYRSILLRMYIYSCIVNL
jgi:hypothetical protein